MIPSFDKRCFVVNLVCHGRTVRPHQIPTRSVRSRRTSSYTPKKMKPPIPIHITRGPTPDMSVAGPSSAQMRRKASPMPLYARPCASCGFNGSRAQARVCERCERGEKTDEQDTTSARTRTRLLAFSRINRVLMTSSGVVTAAATAPARDPQAAACRGETGRPCSLDQRRFRAS